MDDYDDIPNLPPPDALGDDRPSDNEDKLNDLDPAFQDPAPPPATGMDDSDDESLLSEVDEAQFADFDPSAVQVAPDFETLNKAGKIKKRMRTDGEEAPKKKKERTREKVKKNRRRRDSDEGFEGGEEIDGKRVRKGGKSADGEKKKPLRVEINEEDLTPEERRRRALDRAMDAAVKKTTVKRMKKGDIVCYVPIYSILQVLTVLGSRANGGCRNRRDEKPDDSCCRRRRRAGPPGFASIAKAENAS